MDTEENNIHCPHWTFLINTAIVFADVAVFTKAEQ